MATGNIRHLSIFEIEKGIGEGTAYAYRIDWEVGEGRDLQQIIEAAAAGDFAGGRRRKGVHGAPDRLLDIDEERTGTCLYVFGIREDARLEFVQGRPYIELPLNSEGDSETFLSDSPLDHRNSRRAGSFVCDLKAVRETRLAKHIGPTKETGSGHGHPGFLNIPFTLNVVDPELRASPWAVPDHSNRHGGGSPWTHGGAHPPTVSFLTVEL